MAKLLNLFTEAPNFISNIITENKTLFIFLAIILIAIIILKWFQMVNKKLANIN